jgi:hypothetical protein
MGYSREQTIVVMQTGKKGQYIEQVLMKLAKRRRFEGDGPINGLSDELGDGQSGRV